MTAARVPVTIFAAGWKDADLPAYPPGVAVRRIAAAARGLDLHAVLCSLHGDGVTRVMVEGGPTVAAAFLRAGLVDEAVIARGTAALGERGRKPLGEWGLELFEDRAHWQHVEERAFGPDRISIYRAAGHLRGGGP